MINRKLKMAFAMASPLKRGARPARTNEFVHSGRGVFFILLFFMLSLPQAFTQSPTHSADGFAPKKFYLIDSLDLTSLNKTDRQLIDSCLTLYHKTKDDTSKINALNGICENMMHDDWTKYQFLLYHFIEETLLKKYPPQVKNKLSISYAGALNNIGFIYKGSGDIHQALKYFNKSLKINYEIKNLEGIASNLINLGEIYSNKGKITMALEYYSKSINIQEKIGDKRGISINLNSIAFIYKIEFFIGKSLRINMKA